MQNESNQLVEHFNMQKDKLFFVVGATGRQGGAVAKRLLEGGWRVRVLTRDPLKPNAKALLKLGAEVIQGDLSNRSSLDASMQGVYGVFAVTEYWEHGYQNEILHGKNLVDAAYANDVKHFVFSSVGGIERTRKLGIRHFDSKYVIEEHLKKSGLTWSVLRPVTFFENFVSPRIRRSIISGNCRFAVKPNLPFQMLAMQDLGVFAEQALSGHTFYKNRAVEIASQRLTMNEFVEVLSKTVGRAVEYKRIPISVLWIIGAFVEVTRTGGHFKTGWALLRMFNWMNASEIGGWNADLSGLKQQHPELLSAQEWAEGIDWNAGF